VNTLGRVLRLAGLGVWRFVVGDTPEFAVAVVGIVTFALVFHHLRPLVLIGLPVLVVGVLCGSLWNHRRVR
jgi:hypothetical protein